MDPKTNLGYLLHHVGFTLDRTSDQVLQERLGIGFSKYKILMALKWHAHFQQRQIADYLGQTEASISRQIKLLKNAKLLQSRASTKSRRDHITVLTAKGERLAERATDILNSYHGPMFEHLSPKAQSSLSESLLIMHSASCPAGPRCAIG